MVHGESGCWRPGGAAGAAAMAVVVLGGALVAIPPSASAGAVPCLRLDVRFDSPNWTAEPTAGAPAVLNITGHFSTDKVPVDRGALSLWASLDAGWRYTLSPTTAVFASTDPQPFAVTVVVPQGTPANVSATLRVFCRYCHWSSVVNGSTVIDVGQYHGVRVVLEKPVREAGAGQPPRFTAVVTNTGNAVDTYYCTAKSPRIPTTYRWSYSGNRSVLPDLAPGESRTVAFDAELTNPSLRPPEGLRSEVFHIRSMNARDRNLTVGQDIVLTLHMEPEWWARVDVPTAAAVLWGAAMCAILASMLWTGRRRKGRRVPVVKGTGKAGSGQPPDDTC